MLPLSVLTSTAKVYVPELSNGRSCVCDAPRTINHVFFHHSKQFSGDESLDTQPAGKLFVDASQSGGAFEIPVGSKVIVDSLEPMQVISVAPFSMFGKLHHWEVLLK